MATNSKPMLDISLIVPNYNNGAYLEAFLKSVGASSHWPKEVVLVDDGSTDHSLEIIQKFSHQPFLKTIRLPQNKGLVHALNTALDAATGRYLMRADPDDVLLPGRIISQYEFLEKNKDVDCVGCNVAYFSKKPFDTINRSYFPEKHDDIVACFARGDNGIQHPTLLARAEVFDGLRYTEGAVRHEDFLLFCQIIKKGHRLANLPEVHYAMRIHPASATSTTDMTPFIKTFAIRDEYFNKKTSRWEVWRWYWFVRLYRQGQLGTGKWRRLFYFGLAGVMQPGKVIQRLLRPF